MKPDTVRKKIAFNPRLTALDILQSLQKQESNSSILLNRELAKIPDPRDRALVTDLVLGTVRYQKKLSFLIEAFSRRPMNHLDSRIVLILQLGIYQLLHTKIPPHAAIYETVALCKRVRLTSAASFVNGILRAIEGKRNALPAPSSSAVEYSHPEWLYDRWRARFGKQGAIDLMKSNLEPAPIFIRRNTLVNSDLVTHLEKEGIRLQATPFGPDVYRVQEGVPQATSSFVDGEFYIQDAGIELLMNQVSPQPDYPVLEVAAAPGGKTFQLALRMQNRGWIVSVESEWKRMKMWKRNIERLGILCAKGVIADAFRLPFRSAQFQQIFVDAPCSSLGVIRRHPEIKWWREEESLKEFHSSQLQMLQSCAKYVGNQGELIYMVCSFEPEETTDVVEAFLKTAPAFEKQKDLFLYPHIHGTDGFYLASLVRREKG